MPPRRTTAPAGSQCSFGAPTPSWSSSPRFSISTSDSWPYREGSAVAFEVRAFFPKNGAMAEDPVTASLNASLAQWLLGSGRAAAPYIASQGTALGRAGRIHVARGDDGTIWVGGGTITCVSGQVEL